MARKRSNRGRKASVGQTPTTARILFGALRDVPVTSRIRQELGQDASGSLADQLFTVLGSSLQHASSSGFSPNDSIDLVVGGIRQAVLHHIHEGVVDPDELQTALVTLSKLAASERSSAPSRSVRQNGDGHPATPPPPSMEVVKKTAISACDVERVFLLMSLAVSEALAAEEDPSVSDLAFVEEAWNLSLKLASCQHSAIQLLATAFGQVINRLAAVVYTDSRAAALGKKLAEAMDRFHPGTVTEGKLCTLEGHAQEQ